MGGKQELGTTLSTPTLWGILESVSIITMVRLIESMMVLRPQQGNLRQVFRLCKSHARLSRAYET